MAALTTAAAVAYGIIEEETIVLDLSYSSNTGPRCCGGFFAFAGGDWYFHPISFNYKTGKFNKQ